MSGLPPVYYGLAAVAIVLVIAWVLKDRNLRAKEQQRRAERAEASKAEMAERRARLNEVERAREALLADFSAEWPLRAQCEADDRRADMLLRGDGLALRVLPGRGRTDFAPETMYDVSLADVVKVEKDRPTLYRTVRRTKTVYVPQANKKSTIGRTLVGGALLGPVGAIAGAASSMKGPGMKKELRTVDEEEPYEGYPVLLLTTSNLQHPLIKLRLPSVVQTDEWEARIVAGMAKSRELPRP